MINYKAVNTMEPLLDELPHYQFGDYFQCYDPDESHQLLDTPPARRLLNYVHQLITNRLYTYQLPTEGKCGDCVTMDNRSYKMLSSYDYCGLIGHPAINRAAADAVHQHNTGTGGVRLLSGTTDMHCAFEEKLAAFKGTEACITFTSGYVSNLAAISSLIRPNDRVIIDAKAHRSIVDACNLARVAHTTFRHNDCNDLESILKKKTGAKRTLIVAEGIYSMDGDTCPLPDLVALKNRYGAYLMIDDAHSFGVSGASGQGINEHYGISADEVDVWVGTLSKAIPSTGGFVAARKSIIVYMQHGSAPYIFSAACSPPTLAAASAALDVIQNEPQRLKQVKENADLLRAGLRRLNYDTGCSDTHVIPVILGSNKDTFNLSVRLLEQGLIALPIVSPAVAYGQARLRICATATQDSDFIDSALEAFEACMKK